MKYQIEFEYYHELEQIHKVLAEAHALDYKIKKLLLLKSGIRYNEIAGANAVWVDADQPNIDLVLSEEILSKQEVIDVCLKSLGIKTIEDDSNH